MGTADECRTFIAVVFRVAAAFSPSTSWNGTTTTLLVARIDLLREAVRRVGRTSVFPSYSLFVSRKNSQPEVSLACAQAIGEALRAEGQTPSLHHAEPIPGEGRPLADATNGVYFFDDLIVLKTARSPVVFVEAGIVSVEAETGIEVNRCPFTAKS